MTHQMPKLKVELSPSKFFLFGSMTALHDEKMTKKCLLFGDVGKTANATAWLRNNYNTHLTQYLTNEWTACYIWYF